MGEGTTADTTGTSGAEEREAAEQSISRTLGAYAQAYTALNASAVKRVWPTVNDEALRNAFGQLQAQRIAFSDCTIDVRGLHAAATCTGSATYVPKVGNSRRLSVSHRWEFALRKVVDMWVIEAATIK